MAAPALQVWGPPGSGKTAVVLGYLRGCGIQHVKIDCACFSSLAELQARLADEVRRLAAGAGAGPSGQEPNERFPSARQLRTLDRLDAAIRAPLARLAEPGRSGGTGDTEATWPQQQVVVVLDQSQELPRFGARVPELLVALPEILEQGSQITVLLVGRLRLDALGVDPGREPPAVAFPPYTASESEEILVRVLGASDAAREASCGLKEAAACRRPPCADDIRALVQNGLMKFAAPHLGHNLRDLASIGVELLRATAAVDGAATAGVAILQQHVERLVQQRLGLCSLHKLLRAGEEMAAATAAPMAAVRRMTKMEKRVVLAAYLAARIAKDDDLQLFMPKGQRRQRRKGAVVKQRRDGDDAPAFLFTPRPVPLSRLLAIYNRLAQQAQVLGPALLEHVMNLREAGLLRFAADRAVALDREPKVVCRAELHLARACARELNIDMAEYLIS